MAAALVLAQLRGQMHLSAYASTPTLALLYITDHFEDSAQDILDFLSAELPWVTDWSGTVGAGIAATHVEYFDEPAMAVMLLELPSDQYRVFSGVSPLGLGFEAHTALVHADGNTPDVQELIEEMALRTDARYLFGGLSSSSSGQGVQFALAADGTIGGQGRSTGVFSGGLSGVAFGPGVGIVSRLTQGCTPLSGVHTVTEAEHNLVLSLDGQPALDVMLHHLAVTLDDPERAIDMVRATLVGLTTDAHTNPLLKTGHLGQDVMVRGIIGLDPQRRGIAVGQRVAVGTRLVFCQRNPTAARADLMRIGTEIREELEPHDMSLEVALARPAMTEVLPALDASRIAGAVYISCMGRGGAHFGEAHAELLTLRRALGDVPLVGFFADGEIAYNRLYGYSGVLTVFSKAQEAP
jgi:small ligand-binding sensory domain FIST